MNLYMTQAEFDALPSRQGMDPNDVVNGQLYRDEAHPRLVFEQVGPLHRPNWWCFTVDLEK